MFFNLIVLVFGSNTTDFYPSKVFGELGEDMDNFSKLYKEMS